MQFCFLMRSVNKSDVWASGNSEPIFLLCWEKSIMEIILYSSNVQLAESYNLIRLYEKWAGLHDDCSISNIISVNHRRNAFTWRDCLSWDMDHCIFLSFSPHVTLTDVHGIAVRTRCGWYHHFLPLSPSLTNIGIPILFPFFSRGAFFVDYTTHVSGGFPVLSLIDPRIKWASFLFDIRRTFLICSQSSINTWSDR